MSNDNLGRAVKWQDTDGGWHTGRVVLLPDNEELLCKTVRERPQIRYIVPPNYPLHGFAPPLGDYEEAFYLIRESCDGKLTWVRDYKLQPWPLRSEWEQPELTIMSGQPAIQDY